jgi:UDP-N-acetylglucosamine:LPS N-acetylglucosamine transferase
MLAPLSNGNDVFWITEKVKYASNADYYLYQTGFKDKLFLFKMFINTLKSVKIWFKEKPDFVVTTGAMVVLPMAFIAKVMGKKLIFIETYARVRGGTRSGKLMYKYADLFIVQWEPLKEIYPNAVYGGSIY